MKLIHRPHHVNWHLIRIHLSEMMHSPVFWSIIILTLLFILLTITFYFAGDQTNPNRVPTQWPYYLP